VGMLGPTVMPHAVYLHSALVADRHGRARSADARAVLRGVRLDVVLAMVLAGAVNIGMLLVAATTLSGMEIDGLPDAVAGIGDRLGGAVATLFALGLLASGLASTSVGGYAGAVITEGLLHRHIPLLVRRVMTAGPALVLLAFGLNPTELLIGSQVVLSFGLPFALVPLVRIAADDELMRLAPTGRNVVRLAWLVVACKAPDGSYWALQSWQRLKPNYGGTRGAWELHLSHCRGSLAQLVVYQNWAHGRVRHIFGRFTYDGQGVYGFTSTPRGNPLDDYGRNVYVDTYDSAYGKGWHRANGFLTHHRGRTLGDFCFAFYPHAGHPNGNGSKYRATVVGPGVTPDVMWGANDIGPFDPAVQKQMQALERSWGDPKCRA